MHSEIDCKLYHNDLKCYEMDCNLFRIEPNHVEIEGLGKRTDVILSRICYHKKRKAYLPGVKEHLVRR